MPLDPHQIKAIAFDYGNTIIPFGEAELTAYGETLFGALQDRLGPASRDRFFELRAASRFRPYEGDPPRYRENDMREITATLVRELYGREPDQALMEDLLQVRHDAFVDVVSVEPAAVDSVRRLAARFSIGLLSNYPDGPAIRTSLGKIGLADCFSSIVVSGDLGYCKPHPIVYAKLLEELGLKASDVLFVGDNWLADVQGARRLGMPMVHMCRWTPPETFTRSPGDHEPDAVIQDLAELEGLLT